MADGLLNIFSTKVVAWLNGFSVIFQALGLVVLIALIPTVAPTHQSFKYVFSHFNDVSVSTSGITNNGCVSHDATA